MEIMKGELRRLRSGLGAEDGREQPFVVRFRFTAEDPARVVANARAVLTCVVERTEDWPAPGQWPEVLPAWFVRRCAPERSGPQPGPPFPVFSRGPWTLPGWLHHFDPTEEGTGDDRSWWWWDAGSDEPGHGWVEVATTGWPFGSGSLHWLFEASGGGELEPDGP
jgi:hypothetical protein